jgi:hypothetical protein
MEHIKNLAVLHILHQEVQQFAVFLAILFVLDDLADGNKVVKSELIAVVTSSVGAVREHICLYNAVSSKTNDLVAHYYMTYNTSLHNSAATGKILPYSNGLTGYLNNR